MDSDILKEKAFSLVELILVLAATAMLLAIVLYTSKGIRNTARSERTIEEMSSIAKASARYYNQNGIWPVSLSDLRGGGEISATSGDLNPFGYGYTIAAIDGSISVSTLIPKGLVSTNTSGIEIVVTNQGSNDLVTITEPQESATWGLKYDKKYIYDQ